MESNKELVIITTGIIITLLLFFEKKGGDHSKADTMRRPTDRKKTLEFHDPKYLVNDLQINLI